MLRKSCLVIPALLLAFGATSALAAPLTRYQKSAATRKLKARAEKQIGKGVDVKVTYGKNDHSFNAEVLGVGGMTGTQPNSPMAFGSGHVTVHQKPSLVKKKGKVDPSLKGGEFGRVFTAL
jgi:hypothetical protein